MKPKSSEMRFENQKNTVHIKIVFNIDKNSDIMKADPFQNSDSSKELHTTAEATVKNDPF